MFFPKKNTGIWNDNRILLSEPMGLAACRLFYVRRTLNGTETKRNCLLRDSINISDLKSFYTDGLGLNGDLLIPSDMVQIVLSR